jgi:hypothetical protein
MKYTLQWWRRILLIAMPPIVTVWCAMVFWQGAPVGGLILATAMTLLLWASYLRVAYEVELRPDETVEFRAMAGRRVLALAEISLIDARHWNRGFIRVHSPKGVMTMFRGMPGASELLAAVRRCNPQAVIKDGW